MKTAFEYQKPTLKPTLNHCCTEPVNEVLKAKVEANAKLMEQWGFSGTPVLFYRDAEHKVRAKSGVPLLSELPAMTGLAEQVNNDPALARFR